MYWENPIHKNIVNPIPIPNTIAQACSYVDRGYCQIEGVLLGQFPNYRYHFIVFHVFFLLCRFLICGFYFKKNHCFHCLWQCQGRSPWDCKQYLTNGLLTMPMSRQGLTIDSFFAFASLSEKKSFKINYEILFSFHFLYAIPACFHGCYFV